MRSRLEGFVVSRAGRRAAVLRTALLLALGLAALAPHAAAQDAATKAAPTAPAADPADVASIDAIMAAVYDVISGPAGEARDWDRMRSLFAPGARLIPVTLRQGEPAGATILSVEDYIERSGPYLEGNGFFEREVARRVERYGHIAHVFSTYESRHRAEDAEPFMRGINSFQLLYDGGRWWVVTIYWDAERPGQPIPARYLSGS